MRWFLSFSVFSVFEIVRFNNEACTGDDGKSGVCYTAAQCTGMGGTATGNCAMGFGVCCRSKSSPHPSPWRSQPSSFHYIHISLQKLVFCHSFWFRMVCTWLYIRILTSVPKSPKLSDKEIFVGARVKLGGNRFLRGRNETLFCLEHPSSFSALHPTLHKIIQVVKPSWRPLTDIQKPGHFGLNPKRQPTTMRKRSKKVQKKQIQGQTESPANKYQSKWFLRQLHCMVHHSQNLVLATQYLVFIAIAWCSVLIAYKWSVLKGHISAWCSVLIAYKCTTSKVPQCISVRWKHPPSVQQLYNLSWFFFAPYCKQVSLRYYEWLCCGFYFLIFCMNSI